MLRLLILCLLPLLVPSAFAQFDTFPAIRNTQAEGEHPPSPREMLDLFELPEGFKVTLFAGEPDVQQPIAFDFDDFGRIWVAENYTYSARAKIDQIMRDRVIILHDKDGDGEHDERKVFWDNGRMLTGLTWGYGGLWILNDGNLSFIPDKNGDDVPDSEPIPMLNGWTKGAGHNVVNGLLWGPDGWLYGRHGITDTSYPGTIDTPKEERKPMNCGIWRFHPVKHTFEIVCHGTTNPWGLDYNEVGDMFMSNNVIGHLWHVIPGAHYQRMFGQDFNPHCYELMGPISDHYHWDDTGKWSDSRDGKANDLGGGHSHCGLMLYYGQNFPKEYWGKAFMCNTHGRCVNVERIERKGSSYVAKHEPNFLKVNTPWFRGVQLAYGPAGCVYLSDWSDNGECHDHDGVHRTSGRIYRISYGEVKRPNLTLITDTLTELAGTACYAAEGTWIRRKSHRRFIESTVAKSAKVPEVITNSWQQMDWSADPSFSAGSHRLLTLLSASRTLEDGHLLRAIISKNEVIRTKAILALAERPELHSLARPLLNAWLINRENSPQVFRAALAAEALIRNGTEVISPLLEPLSVIRASQFTTSDSELRKLTWYEIEARISSGRQFAVFPTHDPLIRKWAIRRLAAERNLHEQVTWELESWLNVSSTRPSAFGIQDVPSELSMMLDGIADGLSGQVSVDRFPNWTGLSTRITKLNDEGLAARLETLNALFGDGQAMLKLRHALSDRAGDQSTRSAIVRSLSQQADKAAIPVFLSLLNDRAVYVDICKALAAFDDDPRIPRELLKRWSGLRHGAKEAATDTLCSRKSYAVEFTKAIADGRVDAGMLTAAQVRQLNAFDDESITAIIDKHWGVINETPEALEASIAKWKQELTDDVLAKADLTKGAALFKKSCAACHKLYGEGGKIGPDLTGGNRANMDYLLGNIINPSGEVPKQYTVSVIALKSGRLVNGVVVSDTGQTLTVQTDKEQIVVAKADIEEQTRTSKSLMPDGLLDNLKPEEVRDLIAFVRKRR